MAGAGNRLLWETNPTTDIQEPQDISKLSRVVVVQYEHVEPAARPRLAMTVVGPLSLVSLGRPWLCASSKVFAVVEDVSVQAPREWTAENYYVPTDGIVPETSKSLSVQQGT